VYTNEKVKVGVLRLCSNALEPPVVGVWPVQQEEASKTKVKKVKGSEAPQNSRKPASLHSDIPLARWGGLARPPASRLGRQVGGWVGGPADELQLTATLRLARARLYMVHSECRSLGLEIARVGKAFFFLGSRDDTILSVSKGDLSDVHILNSLDEEPSTHVVWRRAKNCTYFELCLLL